MKIIKKLLKKLVRHFLISLVQEVLIEYRNELRMKNLSDPRTTIEMQTGFNKLDDSDFIKKYIGNL